MVILSFHYRIMEITLKKFGNSRALVIPKAILDLFQVSDKTKFVVESESDELVVRVKSEKSERFTAARKSVLEKRKGLYKSLANK